MASAGEHHFASVVLGGIGLSPSTVMVDVALEGAAGVAVPVTAYGPGDVRALDPAAVSRLVPPPGARDFEPNLFAAIELAHPALPWALSPAGSPRLPWLALVVVEEGPGIGLDRSGQSAVLTIEAPAVLARELPELAQAWAWVHGHGTGPAGAAIEPARFGHSAEPTCARLVCPRRLEPDRRYHAALVPVFAAGVRAALGEAPGPADGALAWTAATALPLRLPAYHAWSFSTGAAGDFASLARRIEPLVLEGDAGRRAIDAAAPGWGIEELPGRAVVVGGVLREVGAPSAAAAALGEAILGRIDAAAATAPGETPVLPPPLYGGAAAAVTRPAAGPAWLARINGDVRLRIAAGAGAEIVRRRQDELVDSAWRQLGDGEAANQVLRHAELAAAVSQRLAARYVEAMPDEELVQVIRPAHRRMRLADPAGPTAPGTTLAADIEDSALPTGAARAAFRRLARPGGRVARRAGVGVGGALVERTNRGALHVVPPRKVPDGAAAFDDISIAEHIQPRWSSARATVIAEAAAEWTRAPSLAPAPAEAAAPPGLLARRSYVPAEVVAWTPPLLTEGAAPDAPAIDAFAEAARAHQRYLIEHLGALPPPRRPAPLAGGRLAAVRQRFRAAAAPQRAVMPVLGARLVGHRLDAIEPFRRVTITPSFERPLLLDLAAVGLEHVLPGIEQVPLDRAVLLAPDHGAVAAVIAGANHELAAELRWRGFPGEGRDTLLRRFWGNTARDARGAIVLAPDVPPIAEWPADGPPPPPVGLVLLLRGELLRRYPSAIVYLVEGRWSDSGGRRYRVLGTEQRMPLFRAALAPDTVLHGFAAERDAVTGEAPPGSPGWYVVIEEHPQEPRFGLGAGPAAALHTWRDLAWAHAAAEDLRGGTHLVVDGPLAARRPSDDASARWGLDGAQQAAITLRRPTRIAIHASLLVASTSR